MPDNTLSTEQLQLSPDPQHEDSYYSAPISQPAFPSIIPVDQKNTIQPPSISFNDTPSLEKQMEPTFFNWDKTNADLYTKDKYYKQVGFDPEAGPLNEEKYAQKHTWIDNFRDSFASVIPGAWEAAKNQFTSWKDTLSIFQDPTLSKAFQQSEFEELNKKNRDFQNQYHIFKTVNDEDSFFSWNNFFEKVQGIGPIAGSIAELVAEEAATQLLVAATFGAALPLEAVEGLRAGSILGRTLDKGKVLMYGDLVAKGARTGEALAQDLNNVQNLNKFWKGFGSNLSNILPVNNTAKFILNDVKAAQTAGMTRTALKGFGSFYADMKQLNLAVSMASSNAAGTYQDLQNKLTEEHIAKNGKEPDGLDSEKINDIAQRAAKTDGALNSLAILYTNRLAFGNILKPNKAIQESLIQQGEGVFSKIGIKPSWALKEGEDKFFVKASPWTSFKAHMYALPTSMLEHGVGFGATMSVMEGIDKGVKSYYQAMYDDKHLDGWEAVKEGIDQQFSKEGAQTFISAFLTGAVTLGVGGKLVEGLRQSPDILFNKKGYAERNNEALEGAQRVSDIFNEAWKNPWSPIKDNIHGMVIQAILDAKKKNGVQFGNKEEFHDDQDDATRLFMLNATKNGFSEMYLARIKDLSTSLGEEDLCKAFDIPYSKENYIELKAQIDGFADRAKDLRDSYKEIKRKYPNPFNPFQYKKGTDEYNVEANKFKYYNDSLDYLVWLKDIAARDLERQNYILEGDPKDPTSTGLNSIPGFKEVGSTYLYTLTNTDFIGKELDLSKTELSALSGLTDKESNKQRAYVEQKLNLLSEWKNTLENYSTRIDKILKNPDPEQQVIEADNLKKEFQPLFNKHLGEVLNHELIHDDKEILTADNLDSGVNRMMDYTNLSIKGGNALKAANIILHPEIITRFFDSFQKAGAEKARQAQEKYEQDKAKAKEPKSTETPVDETVTPVPEEVTNKDLAKQKAEKEKQKVEESKKEFQLTRLRNVVNETIGKLEESNKGKEAKDQEIKSTIDQITITNNELAKVIETLKDVDLNKVDKTTAIEEALSKKTELSSSIISLEKHLEGLKKDRQSLENFTELLNNHETLYNSAIEDINKAGSIDIESRLQKLRDLKTELPEERTLKQSLQDSEGQLKEFDKGIKEFESLTNTLKNDLNRLIKYDDLYNKVKDIDSKADYLKVLGKAYSEELDPEKKKFISNLIKLSKHFSGDEILSKDDLKKIEGHNAAEILDILQGAADDFNNLLKVKETEQNKIQDLTNQLNNIYDIDSKIDHLNTLKAAFERPESSFVKEAPFDTITSENSPETAVNSDIGVIPEERRTDTTIAKKVFKPGILLSTKGLHYFKGEVLNKEEGTDRAYSYTSDVYFNPDESYWLQVVTKDNDLHGIINKDFPQGIKLLRVDDSGNPVDKNNKKTTDINEMLHWYMPESHEKVNLLQGDLLNPNAPEVSKIVAELKPKFTGSDLDKSLREEVVKYRQTVATIKNQISKSPTSNIDAKRGDIEKTNQDNQKLGKSTLQKLGYKKENRQANGNVKGGQDGWKIRFNIKNPKTGDSYYTTTGKGELIDTEYHKRAEILINFLLNYFGSTEKVDPNNLQKHYILTDTDGKKREPFKHLTGGEFGESDFTIYIGSGDDSLKFISDIRNKHPEILDLLHAGNTSSDVKIDDIFKGRIEGSKIGFSGYHTPTNLYNITGENDFVFTYDNRRVVIDYGKSKSLNDISIYIEGDKKGYSGIYDKELQKDYPQLFKNIRNIVGFQLYGDYLTGSNDEFVKLTGVQSNAELKALEQELQSTNNKSQRVKIIGKRQGAFSFEPLVDGKVAKNPLQGRVIESKPDYKFLKDPNGQSLQFYFKLNGRVELLRADGIGLPVYNRDLFTHEKDNVINALKRLSLGGLSTDEKSKLNTYLRGTIFFGYPDVESGTVGANRIWIDYKSRTLRKSTVDTKVNPTTKEIENSVAFGFSELEIENTKNELLKNMYHNVNKKLTSDIANPYVELKIVDKGNHQYEIQEAKKWDNYIHYLMAPNIERTHIQDSQEESNRRSKDPILSTNIIKYEKDNVEKPRVKQSNLDFEYLGELVPLSEKLKVAEKAIPKEVVPYPGHMKVELQPEELSELETDFDNNPDNYLIKILPDNTIEVTDKNTKDIAIYGENGHIKDFFLKLKESAKKELTLEQEYEKNSIESKPDIVNNEVVSEKDEAFDFLDDVDTEGAKPIEPNC